MTASTTTTTGTGTAGAPRTAAVNDVDEARLHAALRLALDPPSNVIGTLDCASTPGSGPLRGLARDGAVDWDIATTAAHLGVSAHTLRYYERIGLVRVGRSASGHRRYDAAAVRRLVFLTRMRTSGMTIRDLRRYVGMVEAGQDTVPERLTMLTEHRGALRARIDELRLALAATEFKIAAYTRQLEERATADGVGSVDGDDETSEENLS